MSEPYELRAARVYTADSRKVYEPGHVVVDGNRIAEVGPNAGSEPRPVVDYGDATILPGLIDTHCHITLTGDGKPYEEQVLDPDEMMTLIAVGNMRRHLESGITTLRDNGGRNATTFIVRDAIRRGYVVGPRLLLSGRPLTHSYGHFYWCNGVADGEVEIVATVRRLVAEGADHIKIMASGGATLGNIPYYASYTTQELRWIVEAAHALGRPTTAHCRAVGSMLNAVEAGSDCIEHAEYLKPGEMMAFGGGVAPSGRMVYDPAVTDRLLNAGTYISFTLQAGGLPTLLELRRKAKDGQPLAREEKDRISALDAYFDMKLGILDGLLRDGMKPRMTISTDAGPFDIGFGSLQIGLELAVTGGFTPVEAIDAATSIAADACRISDLAGRIKAGMVADLLVVDGNPLVQIEDLSRVRQVFSQGRAAIKKPAETGIPAL